MVRNRMRGFALVSAIMAAAGIASCSGVSDTGFWKPMTSYDLHLRVGERPSRLPGLPAPVTDSLHVRIMIDSLRGDSLFGRYEGRFDSLAVPVGDMGQSPALVAGGVQDSVFTLVLAPNVIDAELILSGSLRPGVGSGTWRKQSPVPYYGTFEVRQVAK
jgi:hypothetical protein